jgi:methylated-DNA-[protein]-cysteine S-methyltransferase
MDIYQRIDASSCSSFAKQVYHTLLHVPRGKVTTYKALGDAVGVKGYRAIGRVMNKNPFAPDVPCHRVIASNGTLHGYASGLSNKEKILSEEGVSIEKGRIPESFILREL